MSYAPLNNATTGDDYTKPNTVHAPGARRWNLSVNNAAIYYRFGAGSVDVQYGFEVFLAPGFRSFDRAADACQVRSAVPGTPAQVTVEALTAEEVGG